MPASHTNVHTQVVSVLRSQIEEMSGAAVAQIYAEEPAYASNADPAFVEDVRQHCREIYTTLLDGIEGGRPATREDLLFMRRHAAMRVGRVSVTDFVQAFHIIHRVIWHSAVDYAEEADAHREVVGLVSYLGRYFEIATTHAAEVYIEAEQLLATTAERLRRDALEELLAEREPSPGPRTSIVREAGLDSHSPLLVISAVSASRSDDPHHLRAGAASLARAARTPVLPLTVQRHDEIVIVSPISDTDRAFAERVVAAQRRLTERGIRLGVGMSTVHDGLDHVAEAYQEAVKARGWALPEGRVVALPMLTTFEYLIMSRDRTSHRLVTPALMRFLSDDADHGGTLTRTLEAYATSGLNAKETAERLGIHVNTAHYRLARIAERTGSDLRRLSDVIELVIASRLVTA